MENIKEKFKELSIKHGEAIEIGNNKVANKIHGKLMTIYESIKKEESWHVLKELSQEENESVKLWSATFLLKSDTEIALNLLNDLKQSDKIIGLTASTTIDMWNKGMLQL